MIQPGSRMPTATSWRHLTVIHQKFPYMVRTGDRPAPTPSADFRISTLIKIDVHNYHRVRTIIIECERLRCDATSSEPRLFNSVPVLTQIRSNTSTLFILCRIEAIPHFDNRLRSPAMYATSNCSIFDRLYGYKVCPLFYLLFLFVSIPFLLFRTDSPSLCEQFLHL